MNHTGTVIIETERLILRPIRIGDERDMFVNWASDPEVTRFLSWPTHESVAGTRNVVSFWVQKYSSPDYYNWALELRESGQIIGNLEIHGASEKLESAEIGYCMSRKYWGSGIMSEAAGAIVKHLMDAVGYYRICARHHPDNIGSGRVMQKIGMQYEGRMRGAGRDREGNFYDLMVYAILRDDDRRGR